MESNKAVLTADIVNSSLMEGKDLNDLIVMIRSEFKKAKVASEFYRGDSFHLLTDVKDAFKMALSLRVLARQIPNAGTGENADIRIAIGLGKVQDGIKSMALGKGEAFLLSGRELDAISKSSVRLSIRCSDDKIGAGMEALALLADMILKELSIKQAEVVSELLMGYTQMEVALKLKKSQSTINKLAQAGKWSQLEKASQIYRKLANYILD
ncbi:hypothetical protein B0I27_10623 [Arcticibacter pallidicorallinus]|uniref:SatD family protein n=1 Tax=Arcticibacter pallidicorallinus TaxID=1259464 RepID=A0A2T0U2X7_9SPHI|nr:hypothetical protein [Arcticibacter pallidicorallinus]PRY52265.1 hypothetical protein B0I27_10623 [Arcticibacter pallidicorallinus]